MKLKKEFTHKITIKNDYGDEAEVLLVADDIIQSNAIVKASVKLNDIVELIKDDYKRVTEEEDLASASEILNKMEIAFREINEQFDIAFGEGFSKKMFRGRMSITIYDSFFEQIFGEVEELQKKANAYIDKKRREALVQDHKPKDTL